MNKSELVEAIAAKTGQSKTNTERTLNALLETIVDRVAEGQPVTLVGFGSFKAASRNSREGRNPATGEAIHIEATVVPRFAPGATFKARVNGH